MHMRGLECIRSAIGQAELTESIRAIGVQVPVEIDLNLNLVDGIHRLCAALDTGQLRPVLFLDEEVWPTHRHHYCQELALVGVRLVCPGIDPGWWPWSCSPMEIEQMKREQQ